MLKKEYTMRMIENRVVREVFGPKGKEVTGDWRKYNEENHSLYVLQSGTLVIKWRRIRKVGHEVQ